MKILKIKDIFKKMPDKNWADAQKINKMIEMGWRFASHKDYKESNGIEKIQKNDTDVSTVKEKKNKEKSKSKLKSKK